MVKWARLSVSLLVLCAALPGFAANKAKQESPQPTPMDILVDYIQDARFADFPEEVVKKAKYLLLDNVGCVLGAAQTDIGRNYLALGRDLAGSKEATILGSGTRTSSIHAAYVNGQMANVLDFDDVIDWYVPAHPGNAFVQTSLALGEALGASGEEVLTAFIVGCEVACRVGRAAGSIHWQEPLIYADMTLGTAAISARLLRLDKEQTRTALHHARIWGGGGGAKRQKFDLRADVMVTDMKNAAGVHAANGIMAALRAKNGLSERRQDNPLEKDIKGWYLFGGELSDYTDITRDLGKLFRMLAVSFKPTPSCRLSHAAVTALRQALAGEPVKEEDVEEIVIKGVKRLDRPKWEEMLEAQFSMQCIVAMTALGVEPGPKWYVGGRFNDADVKALAAKVKLETDPEAELLEIKVLNEKCTAKVVFKDGKVREATTYHAKGGPGNPMSYAELQDKFRANTRALFKASQVEAIIAAVLDMEKMTDISQLTRLLVSKKLSD